MLEAMQIAFWATATTIVSNWLVPIVTLILAMGLIWSALGIGSRR